MQSNSMYCQDEYGDSGYLYMRPQCVHMANSALRVDGFLLIVHVCRLLCAGP
jgi:hypothetical protein